MKLSLPDAWKYRLGALTGAFAISPQLTFALQDPNTAIKIQDVLQTLGLGIQPGFVQVLLMILSGYLLKKSNPETKLIAR